MEVDYSKITLCPALQYKIFCGAGGHCEYCSFFVDGQCEGCGANFENKPNPNAKFDKEIDRNICNCQK